MDFRQINGSLNFVLYVYWGPAEYFGLGPRRAIIQLCVRAEWYVEASTGGRAGAIERD